MDFSRRRALQMAALAATASPFRRAFAQGGANTAAQFVPKPYKIDAYSRHLQWLRSPGEVAQAVTDMGFDGLDITVRPYPGHVDPERVATDLPPFVEAIRRAGLQVRTITAPITDADSPHAEAILDTAASLGIHHYWWGTFRYQPGKSVMDQLDALKPRVAKLARLNAKYGMKAMYHTYSGPSTVGAAIWDLLSVFRDFDPAHVSFHYDTGHMANAGGNGTWALNLRAAGAYVGGLSIKDSVLEPGPVAGQNGAGATGLGRSQANGWHVRQVPLGTGMVDLPMLAQILKEIAFDGPVEIQAEYPNGGADNAQDKLSLPRDRVLGAMRRDLSVLKDAFGRAGLV